MNRRNIRDALVFVVLAAFATSALSALGSGVLAAPRTWGLDGWAELVTERGPAASGMTVLRYVALGLSSYLVVLGLLTLTSHLVRVRWLDAALWFVTPRILRPVLGIVTMATFAGPHAAGAAETASKAPVMVLVGSRSGAPSMTTSTTMSALSAAPTMRRVNAPAATVTTMPMNTPPTTTLTIAITVPAVVTAPATKVTMPTQPSTWRIRRGEHLWYVAETTLAERLERTPSTQEIARYWDKVVRANRDRLVDPENPDLVFTDQEFVLPPQ